MSGNRELFRCQLMLCLLLLTAIPARAHYVISEASVVTGDCYDPALACSPDGVTQVAWEEEGVGIWTQSMVTFPTDAWETVPAVFHGPGSRPALCWAYDRFVLAYTVGNDIIIHESDTDSDFTGAEPQVFETALVLDWSSSIDLLGNLGELSATRATLTISGVQDPDSYQVLVMRRGPAGWLELELLAGGLYLPGRPQVARNSVPGDTSPRVYYIYSSSLDELALVYRDLQPDGTWAAPVDVPGQDHIGGEFDAAGSWEGRQAILTIGPQPTCPCNTIHYLGYDPETENWSESEDLTVQADFYDWPMTPNTGVDPDGVVHVFWFQQTSSYMMEPYDHIMPHFRSEGDGIWSTDEFPPAYFEGPGLEYDVTMHLEPNGHPLFAWARRDTFQGTPYPRNIWIARPADGMPVGDDQTPAAGLTVYAAPNPFNPEIVITIEGADQTATVEVYDMRGRRVVRVQATRVINGSCRAVWKGRNDRGQEMPSGAYLLKVRSSAGQISTRKVMLAR